MSIAPSEFWSRLVQSGLADDSDCQRYTEDFSKNNDGSDADDSESLAASLVSAGLLTNYQARQLTGSDEPVLRVGSFVMTSDQPIPPLSHWIPVQTVHGQTEPSDQTRRGFLLRVPLASLDEARRSWLAVHSEIQSETLQPIELSGGAQSAGEQQTVEIFSQLPEGAPLWKVLQSKPKLSLRKTVRIGVDLARALQTLHTPTQTGLVIAHGAVGADHVWVTSKGHGTLLRDPSSPARSPQSDLSSSWIDRIESPALYAAPELSDPAALPTPASDIYSLGCLLFSVLVGRPAFSGADDRELFAAHNQSMPTELLDAVQQGASGDPIFRVLASAMAKDPTARFDSAAALAEALSRAGELADGKSSGIKKKVRSEAVETAAKPPPPPAVTASPEVTAPPAASDVVEPASDATDSSASAADPEPESEPRLRKRRKRSKNRLPILAGMLVLPLLLLGLAVAIRGRGPQKRRPRNRPSASVVKNVPKVRDSRTEFPEPEGPVLVNGYEIVENDRLLWVPPYSAESAPPSLELLPPGPAAIISIPIARVFQSDGAKPLTTTFAPEFESLVTLAEKRAGVPREQIARCTIALFPGKNGWPESALAIDLTEPIDRKTIAEKWQAVESRTPDGAVIYAGEANDSDAYFIGGGEMGKLPDGVAVQRFAVGSLARIREIAETGGGTIPLVRSMKTLWNRTSSENDMVALFTPNFLFADGREMLSSTMPQFRSPLKQWLIPNVAAVSLTVSAKDSALYVELRELPSGGATAATLLKSFRESIDQWPEWGDSFILESVPDPSWRLLAARLPLMLRFVNGQTRSTIVGETVVASTYLPVDAGAQVALATLLAMNTQRGGEMVAQTLAAKPLTVDEILDRPMSISFLQLSLQFAVDAVVDEFKQSLPEGSTMPKVRIVGGDLEKNGITQNQQISGFERNDQPFRKVLTDLVLGANPDKTATGPNDEKQSLVWVVYPSGKSPDQTEILITTRDAAAGQYDLPVEFVLSGQADKD